jgi:hypothetical protein
MTNDLFDTFKDSKEGIHTFANMAINMDTILSKYNEQKHAFHLAISRMPLSNYQKHKFQIQTSLIPAFGDLAIEQLTKLKVQTPIINHINHIKRSNLIIDMEKPANILRFLYFTYLNGKTWK